MSYLLAGSTIKRPLSMTETNNTQVAQQRTLKGTIARDYFGDNKRVWVLNYKNLQPADYATIKAIYDSYLSTGSLKTFQVTESNYTLASTNVHVDLLSRDFNVGGANYISDFALILTEA